MKLKMFTSEKGVKWWEDGGRLVCCVLKQAFWSYLVIQAMCTHSLNKMKAKIKENQTCLTINILTLTQLLLCSNVKISTDFLKKASH